MRFLKNSFAAVLINLHTRLLLYRFCRHTIL